MSKTRGDCCPAYEPQPRRITPTAGGLERAARLEGVEQDALGREIEERKLSRRSLMQLAGATGVASMFAAGDLAWAHPHSRAGEAVFDTRAIGKVHTLPSTASTVRIGAMDPAAPPVLEISSGDVVHYPNTWVNWADEAKYGMSFEEREPIRKRYPQGPHSLVGPVIVRGAEPGDVIECRMLRLRPIEWGWNSAPLGVGALPGEFTEPYLRYLRFDAERRYTQHERGVRIPLAPIQGVIAAEPQSDKPVSAILSGAYGGNVILSELIEGTSLFIAVETKGARLWTGDSHAAQGDGVVNQTAIETAMEDLRIQYVLHKRVALSGPMAETPTHWIVLGFAERLEDALTASLRQILGWLSAASGLSKHDVYSLCSISGSFRVTQYSHQTGTAYIAVPSKAVHGMIPKAIFDRELLARISRSMRPGA